MLLSAVRRTEAAKDRKFNMGVAMITSALLQRPIARQEACS
jgi:hypothetical protein